VTLIRPGVLLLAAFMAAPALWHAAVDGQLDVNTALTRFLLAVPVAIAMVAGLRFLTASYRHAAAADLVPNLDESTAQRAGNGADHGAEPIRRTEPVGDSAAAA
jgi:hypothetical protein